MTTFKQEINGQYHDQKLQEGLEMDYKQNVFNLTSNQLIAKKKKTHKLSTCYWLSNQKILADKLVQVFWKQSAYKSQEYI